MNETRYKRDPDNIPKIKKHIATLEAEIADVRELVGTEDSPRWQKIKKILDWKLSSIDLDLDNFAKMPEVELHADLQMRKDMRLFTQLVEGGAKTLEDLNGKLSAAKEKLSEYERGE